MEKVLANLDETRKKILDLVNPMSEEKFSGRLVPEMWSIAENLHHVTIVENRYVSEIQEALKNPKPMSALRRLFQVPGWMAEIRLIKVKAPKYVEPLNAPPKKETINNFEKTRNELKEICKQAGEKGMLAITVKHPFFGDMDGVNSVVFLGAHEVRHYKQILETIEKEK
ncbi:MAG: DinB family protein [Acidobacteria bacterium]|nr:DinB family protein [Acidobacteriota bacterium]